MDTDIMERYWQRFDDALHQMKNKLGAGLSQNMECGLTPEQFILLRLLSQNKRMTVSEIAAALRVKPSAVSIMADRLFKNQWIHRQRNVHDRRVVCISLSEQGEEVINRTIHQRKEIMKKYMSQLEKEEVELFISVHEKLANIIANEELSR